MPEKEEEKLRKLLDIIPKLSDFDKGYILGKGEGIMDDNRRKEESRNEIKQNKACC